MCLIVDILFGDLRAISHGLRWQYRVNDENVNYMMREGKLMSQETKK